MRRQTIFLLIALLVECVVLGLICNAKLQQAAAPVPRIDAMDSVTAEEISKLADDCTTGPEFHKLGIFYLGLNFYPEAAFALGRASELTADSAELAFDYGFALKLIGETEKSNEQFQKAIDLKSAKSAEAMYFIGRNHLRTEDSEKALTAFNKAARIPKAKYESARIATREGRFDDAKELLKDIGRSQPNRVQTSSLLATIAEKQEQQPQKIRFEIETDAKWKGIDEPNNVEWKRINYEEGKIGFSRKQAELIASIKDQMVVGSIAKLRKLQDDEWNRDIQDFFIERAFKTSRFEEAIKLIEERNARVGPSSKWLSRLGECHLNNGNHEEAIKAWIRGAELFSDGGGRTCYESISRYYTSVKPDIQKSIPFQVEGLGAMIFESVQHRQFNDGFGFAKKLVSLDPSSAESSYLLGVTQLGTGRLEEAVSSFKKCIELDPTHGRALRQLSTLGQ
ncbi:MAG: tetratricopeptide repeat protein [Mariniblastus sp.]